MKYNTLIFDAFDTVIHINESKLPTLQVNGKTMPTTAPAAYEAYRGLFGQIDFDVFHGAFSQSFHQINERKRADHKEVLSPDRFKIMLEMLGHPVSDITDAAAETITRAHMGLLKQSFEVRPEILRVLEWAKGRYRTAMISNFAYAPTFHEAIDEFDLRTAFETIVVSAEVGWCKPHRIIFDHTFEKMGIRPSDALFFGDQLYIDVYGALNSGMDVVWIETARQDWLPAERESLSYKPTYTVRLISEVIDILEKES